MLKSDSEHMQTFDKITIVPSRYRKGAVFCGGPIWPDWDSQILPRHCRAKKPIDFQPDPPEKKAEIYDGELIWAGPVYWQFGHQVAEFATRLAQSTKERDGAKLLFGLMPQHVGRMDWATLPNHFREIIDWFGLRETDIKLCHEPIFVSSMRVASQGEQLGGVAPKPYYLDLLDENWDAKRLIVKKKGIVFVSRAELPPFAGNHAGAGYLDEVLRSYGVEVIYPEKMALAEQLKTYQSASTLIFSEGSSLHGLQLLGRKLSSVYVLNRRGTKQSRPRRMAVAQLLPRARNLKYINAIEGQLHFYASNGQGLENSAITLFDTERLFDSFFDIGIDLRKHWDASKYSEKMENDVRIWLERSWERLCGKLSAEDQHYLFDDLEKAGLKHLYQFASKIIQSK